MANEKEVEITLEDGRKFTFSKKNGFTITYYMVADVTDLKLIEKHTRILIVGTYETKED